MPEMGTAMVEDGVWVRKGGSPYSPAVRSWLNRRPAVEADDKENMPRWGIRRCRRRPLPDWYSRTPLRDITTIVKTLERRRTRMRAAAARRRSLGVGSTPPLDVEPPLTPTLPLNSNASREELQVEHPASASLSAAEQQTSQSALLPTVLPTDASASGQTVSTGTEADPSQLSPGIPNLSSPDEYLLDTAAAIASEHPTEEHSVPRSIANSQPTNEGAMEQIECTIDAIEKAVTENLVKKKKEKAALPLEKKKAVWRSSVLRSMR